MKIKKLEKHERMYGPHFNEECALKVVSKMENEDGSIGQHWSIQESISLANRYGINFSEHFNKYDWYVALNMVYSDFYTVIKSISVSDTTRFFVELAKAWLKDKDVDEGKMWYYYKYVMCDAYHEEYDDDYDDYVDYDFRSAVRPKANKMLYREDYNRNRHYDYDRYEEPLRERITSRY